MSWRNSFFLLILVVYSCSQPKITSGDGQKVTSNIDTTQLALTISIPQNSGLAFVDYKKYTVENDSLFVILRSFRVNLQDTVFDNAWLSDTLEKYKLDRSDTEQLKTLIQKTDSLGDHHAKGCLIQYGWPRFFINAQLSDKKMEGFVTNCYREHIFQFVDFMNDCYPKGKVIDYSVEELIATEKECEEYDYGREK